MTATHQTIEWKASRRLPIRVMVEYSTVEDFLIDYTANRSIGGMFIRTERPFDIGTRFRLRFRVPTHRRLVETCGEVCWTANEDEFGADPGMGVKFDTLTPSHQKAVEGMFRDYWRAERGGSITASFAP